MKYNMHIIFKKRNRNEWLFTGNVSSLSRLARLARLVVLCDVTGMRPSACVTLNFDLRSARSSSRNHTLGMTVHK